MLRALRPSPSRVRPALGRTGLRLLLALFYVALGVSGALHAPHFSRAETVIGSDRHQDHEAANDASCALCTVKNAPHQAHASVVPFLGAGDASFARLFIVDGTRARFNAFLARGPPARLS
jgi:hypothetical protein